MGFYHEARGRASPAIVALVALVLPTTVRAAWSLPAQPAAPSTVASRIESAVVDLVAHGERMLDIVSLKLPPAEERRTRYALGYMFRPSKVERVAVEGAAPDGRIGRIEVRITGLDVFGLRVDRVVLEVKNAVIDPARLAAGALFVTGGDVRVTVSVRQDDICRASTLYRVELKRGDFALMGKTGVLFVRAGFRVHGRLVPTPENQLVFVPKSLKYGIIPVPRPILAAAVKRVNPVFDMARFLGAASEVFDIRFKSVDHLDGQMVVTLEGPIRQARSVR